MNEPSVRTAISYVRFSSRKQNKLGGSVERQLEQTRSFCLTHNLFLDESLSIRDLSVSAYRGKNTDEGNLATFIEGVKAGTIQQGMVLCVEALDRITRQEITKAVHLFTEILMVGIDIGLVSDNKVLTKKYVDDNPMELIVAVSYLIRGHDESRMKGERTSEAVDRMLVSVKAGKPCKLGGYLPPWITFQQDKFVINNKKSSVVKRIFSEYLNGKGTTRLVKDLVKDKAVKWNNVKAPYKAGGIRTLLYNKQVIGTLTLKKQEFPNYLPAIVDKIDFDKVQVMLSRNEFRRGNHDGSVNNLFSGLAKCEECGGPMVVHVSSSSHYINCLNSRDSICEVRQYLKMNNVEQWVFGVLLKAIPSIVLKQQDTSEQREVDRLEAELRSVEKKINDLRQLIGVVPVNELQSDLMTCSKQRDTLNQQLLEARVKVNDGRVAPAKFGDCLKLIRSDLKNQDTRRKIKALLPSIIKEVRIHARNNDITIQLRSGAWIGNEFLSDEK